MVVSVRAERSTHADLDTCRILCSCACSADKQVAFDRTTGDLSQCPAIENVLQILFALTFTLRAMRVRQPRLLKFLALTSMLLIQVSSPLSRMRVSIQQEANIHVPLLPRCASFVYVVGHRSLSRTNPESLKVQYEGTASLTL